MHEYLADHQMLENITDHLDGAILCLKNDENLTIVYANAYFYRVLGYEYGSIHNMLEGYPDSLLRLNSFNERLRVEKTIRQNGFAEEEMKLIKKDGHHIWAGCRLRMFTDDDGQEFFCAILFDVTQEHRSRQRERAQMEAIKKAKSELAESEERYRIIMEQAADPIFDYDLKTRRVYSSPSFTERFDFDAGAGHIMDKLENSDFVYKEDREKAVHSGFGILSKNGSEIGEYRLKTRRGKYCWYRVKSTVIRNEAGDAVRVILFFTDIDKQMNETIRMKEKAERDLLTGLYNHVTTTSLIDDAIRESPKESRHALFVIDIDNFKKVNDQLGHLYGDEVIEEIGIKLKDQFREEDIVGRIGGDEFVVFLRNIPSEKILRLKSRILNELFRGTQSNGKVTCKISCSVGVSLYPADGRNYHELFQKADIAMYAAKRSGKDVCCIYSKELQPVSPE